MSDVIGYDYEGEKVALPPTGNLLIAGPTGSGKTNACLVLASAMRATGLRVRVFDSLRETDPCAALADLLEEVRALRYPASDRCFILDLVFNKDGMVELTEDIAVAAELRGARVAVAVQPGASATPLVRLFPLVMAMAPGNPGWAAQPRAAFFDPNVGVPARAVFNPPPWEGDEWCGPWEQSGTFLLQQQGRQAIIGRTRLAPEEAS